MRATILMILAGFLLAACNTMQGVGKDLEAGGKAIERATTKK